MKRILYYYFQRLWRFALARGGASDSEPSRPTDTAGSHIKSSFRTRWTGTALLLGGMAANGLIIWFCQPEKISSAAGVLFHDQGHAYHVADVLHRGGMLYRDVFYNYGPLPAYSYTYWSLLAGNTIGGHYVFLWLFVALHGLVLYLGMTRRMAPVPAVLLLLFFLLPQTPLKFGILYPLQEAVLVTAFAVIWRSPLDRGTLRALGLGLMLGAMQWEKFGTAFAVGLCMLLVDARIVGFSGIKNNWASWMRQNLWIAMGFLLTQLILWLWLSHRMPDYIAISVLWPSYVVKWYNSNVPSDARYPIWLGLNYFIGAQLAPLTLILLAGCGMGRVLWRPDKCRRLDMGAAILTLTYGVSVFVFYRHVWHYYQYIWLFLPGAWLMFLRLRRVFRVGVLAACVFPWLVLGREITTPPKTVMEKVTLPNGEKVYADPAIRRRIEELTRLLKTPVENGPRSEKPLLVFPIGSGIYHFFGERCATRHAWLAPGIVLPEEEGEFLQGLREARAVVVFTHAPTKSVPGPNPNTWAAFLIPGNRGDLLSETNGGKFSRWLEGPGKVDAQCWIFPVRAEGN